MKTEVQGRDAATNKMPTDFEVQHSAAIIYSLDEYMTARSMEYICLNLFFQNWKKMRYVCYIH
jgi:beta-glucanase (GH16 family)